MQCRFIFIDEWLFDKKTMVYVTELATKCEGQSILNIAYSCNDDSTARINAYSRLAKIKKVMNHEIRLQKKRFNPI